MADIDSAIAKLARETRKVCRLTQGQFGRLVGVDHARVSKWERGTATPPAATVKLLQILNADPASVMSLLEGLLPQDEMPSA
jgi:DNA-binding transcriptional regulator YiaG